MERDEAKAILELCRPGNLEDQNDPMIAEALALLGSDAELKAWFEEQQALDARIADSFEAVEPPADLKASILAGMRAHSMKQEEKTPDDKVVSFEEAPETKSASWWRQPWVGIAAAIVLLFVIVGVPQQMERSAEARKQSYASLLPDDLPQTIRFLATEIDGLKNRSFDKRSNEAVELKSFLASVGSPSPAYLPKPVEDARSLGCFALDFDGIEMGMICFKEDELMHLTTMRKEDCIDGFPAEPTIYETPGQAFKVWQQDDQIYILSIHGEKEELPGLI